jgi:hypothetical protein
MYNLEQNIIIGYIPLAMFNSPLFWFHFKCRSLVYKQKEWKFERNDKENEKYSFETIQFCIYKFYEETRLFKVAKLCVA